MGIKVTILDVLKEKGMTQDNLCQLISMDNSMLSAIVLGKKKEMQFRTLARICRGLGCQPGDILQYVHEAGDELPAERLLAQSGIGQPPKPVEPVKPEPVKAAAKPAPAKKPAAKKPAKATA